MAKLAHHNEGRGNEKGTGKGRGSVNNARRLEAFRGRHAGGSADWGGCDPARLQSVVVSITGLGGAVTIGLSRDKGAHSLTLLLDGGRETFWFNGGADLDAELDDVLGVLGGMEE